MSKHAAQEVTDWTHYTYEAHLACSLAMERLATRLGELGFPEACKLAQEEAKEYHLQAERVKNERQETERSASASETAPTTQMQKFS